MNFSIKCCLVFQSWEIFAWHKNDTYNNLLLRCVFREKETSKFSLLNYPRSRVATCNLPTGLKLGVIEPFY